MFFVIFVGFRISKFRGAPLGLRGVIIFVFGQYDRPQLSPE